MIKRKRIQHHSGQLGNFHAKKLLNNSERAFQTVAKKLMNLLLNFPARCHINYCFLDWPSPTCSTKMEQRLVKGKTKQLPSLGFSLFLMFAPCRESRTVLDSGFRNMDSGLCQQNLDSGFQSLVGFRIPWAVFRIQKPRIRDTTSKILLDSGFLKQNWISRISDSGFPCRG